MQGKQLARTEAEDVEMADESPVAALKEDENTAPGPKEAKAADTSSSKARINPTLPLHMSAYRLSYVAELTTERHEFSGRSCSRHVRPAS